MTDRTESTFEVSATRAEAWKALEGLRARTSGAGEWWLPGFECRAAAIEAEPDQRLTVRKLDEPCADTVIDITFEHTATGCRIHVVQSGFDEAFVKFVGEPFWIHAEHLFTDMHVFFETGVIAERAWLPWAPLGVGVTAEQLGVKVTSVQRGTWADRAGVRADDVLLTVAGAPIYTVRELGLIERIVHAGDDVLATWARDGARCQATAAV
jgi:hypothetical protein